MLFRSVPTSTVLGWLVARRGFLCARPLTPAVRAAGWAAHAEDHRPGGEMLHGDTPDVAELADVTVAPPSPNPRWVAWDHDGPGVWPPIDVLDSRDRRAVPALVVGTARRARIRAADLPAANDRR